MRSSTLRRCALGTLAAALLAFGLAACDDALTGSASAGQGTALKLRLSADMLGNSTDAFARVDAAHVVVSQASHILLDTLVSFSGSGDGRLSLDVRLQDPSVAVTLTVVLLSGGRVLFQGSGSAQAQRGASVTIPLSITPVVAGLAAPDSVLLTALGDTVRLRGAAVFASGDTVSNLAVTWTMDAGGVAQVRADGLLTALREGQGTATAAYQTFTRTTRVRVQAVVARITLSADTFSLQVDSSRALTAVARDRNGNTLQRTFTWRSSNTAVATVDGAGVVKGVGAGSAVISAGSESQSASATVTVRSTPVAAVKVTPASATLLPGDTARLKATTLDATGAILSGRVVSWASDNAAVAAVDGSGLVTAVAVGSATITATSEGKSGTAAVQVVQPIVAVGSTSATFSLSAGGSGSSQTVSVNNGGTGTLTGLTVGVAYSGTYTGWLSASLASTTAPTSLTLTATPGALAVGTYNATVTVGSSLRGAGSVQIGVQLSVQNQQPVIGISPAALTLHVPWDTGSVAISNTGGGSLTGLSAAVTSQTGPGCSYLQPGWLSPHLIQSYAPTRLMLTASGYSVTGANGCTAIVTVSSTVPGVASATMSVTYQ